MKRWRLVDVAEIAMWRRWETLAQAQTKVARLQCEALLVAAAALDLAGRAVI